MTSARAEDEDYQSSPESEGDEPYRGDGQLPNLTLMYSALEREAYGDLGRPTDPDLAPMGTAKRAWLLGAGKGAWPQFRRPRISLSLIRDPGSLLAVVVMAWLL